MYKLCHLALLAFFEAIILVSAVSSNAQLVRCEGHEGGVGSVALSSNGELAVSSDRSSFARVWNTSNGKEIQRLQVFPSDTASGFISAVALSPNGHVIATAARCQPVHFWDSTTGKRHDGDLPVKQAAYSLAFSPDGSRLAVGELAEVKVWDLRTRKVLHDFKFDDRLIGQAWRVVFSPDGAQLAAALLDYGGSFVPKAAKVRVWDVPTGAEVFSAWPDQSASTVSFSEDGKLAAGGGGIVEVWDLTSKQSLCRFNTDEGGVHCLTFIPDGKLIATGGNRPNIKFWDASRGKKAGELAGHKKSVHFLRFSDDGKTFVSAGSDTVLVWRDIEQHLVRIRNLDVQKEK